jgi:sigma-E factor negative regulatory protein RseC
MEQVGFVRRIIDDKAELEVMRASGCGNCNGCGGGCETSTHIVTIKNTINASVGDLVELKANKENILKYTMIVYMIPFIFLIAGIVLGNSYFKSIGNSNYELLSFATGILFLVISYFILRVIDKKIEKKDKSAIVMTRIL